MIKRNLGKWLIVVITVINLLIFSNWLAAKLTNPAHAQEQQVGRYMIAGNGHTQRFMILDTMTGEYWQVETVDVSLSQLCGPWDIRKDSMGRE